MDKTDYKKEYMERLLDFLDKLLYTAFLLKKENDFENLYVVNFYRPLTKTPEEALEVMREIEAAGGVPVTGIVNNSNLGADTTADAVRSTYGAAATLARLAGVPVVMTTVQLSLAKEMEGDGVTALSLQKKYW